MTGIAPFTISCPTKVNFGPGAHRKLPGLLPESAGPVVLVEGGSGRASAPVRSVLAAAGAAISVVSCPGEPSVRSVNDAWETVKDAQAACIIACGGGSVIDTAKALRVALSKGARLSDADFGVTHGASDAPALIVLPTTAGTGSEVTANAVLGSAGSTAKISLRGPGLQPQIAVVDPDLMRGAPKTVILFSGLDAVVQNIESFTSAYATPFTRAISGPAVDTTLTALRAVLETDDAAAWDQLAWGSLASGMALANGGLGAAHGLASILGGAYGAPHGGLCGRLLIPVMRANLASPRLSARGRADITMCQEAIAEVFTPTDPCDPYSGFQDWLTAQKLPRLRDWGVREVAINDLASAGANASSTLKNTVTLEPAALAGILREAL